MAKQGFLVLLKRVFEVHVQSAAVMEEACGTAGNLSVNNGNFIVVLALVW